MFPQSELSLEGTTFNLTPEVDFEKGKIYSLIFSVDSGTIDVKGTTLASPNINGVGLARDVVNFVPYIRRDKGYEYFKKDVKLSNASSSSYVLGFRRHNCFCGWCKSI